MNLTDRGCNDVIGSNKYKILRGLRRAELIRYWLPALIWSAVLLAISGRAGSGTVTAGFLEWFIPASHPYFELVHFIVRKSLHLSGYGLLGYLDFRAVRGPRTGWTLRWSAIAVVLAVVIASLDEWHQSHVPGRTGVGSDVVIDCCGAMVAQILIRRMKDEG